MNAAITHDLPALRFLTCGSVDDGKSTLLGRLLHDAGAIPPDVLAAAAQASRARGLGELDLSLLTDGLLSEREQGITIDVAYRYFGSGSRRFILADAPGHEQYTRNMATAASTADLAILLVDARKGILPQTRRHAALAHLLGVREVIVAVNKLDLAGWSEAAFKDLRDEFTAFADRLGLKGAQFIPLSALRGDMVVARGPNLPWYGGPTLLELLERAGLEEGARDRPFRFPVQSVRRHGGARRYLGRVASGGIRVGDAIAAFPSGLEARVASLDLGGVPLDAAREGQSVALGIDADLDIARGDLLADPVAPPVLGRGFEATLCWFDDRPLEAGRRYRLRHGPKETFATVERLDGQLDLHTLALEPTAALGPNGLGIARLRCHEILAADPYAENRATGAFILVDEATNATVAGGLIRAAISA
jgi:sulfate adenylyltransferase subunit 1